MCECTTLRLMKLPACWRIREAMSDTIESGQRDWFGERRPHILMGVTSPQTTVVLADRIHAFREAGYRVSLLSSPGELLNQNGGNQGAEPYAIPMQRGISVLADCVALFRIWRLIGRLKPDIVEFSTPKAGLLGSIAACLCRVPVRIYFLRGLKLETSDGLKRFLLLSAEKVAAQCAHVVVCNSRSLRDRALQCGIAGESKLLVLGEGSSNGVNTKRFSQGPSRIREQLGIPNDATVVGFVGRLTRDKGLPELLEAFASLLRCEPDAYLLLVGWFDASEDELDLALRERIESHPRVIQTGFVQDTAPYYRAMDLLVLPSWREGFPNVVLEASASGVPVVATNCTGSRDAVVPGVTGLLIPPGEPDAMRDAMQSLLHDPNRLRMSKAARAWVEEHFESSGVLGRTIAFYSSLMKPPAKRLVQRPERIVERATGLSVSP